MLKTFAALAEPSRFRIMELLSAGPVSVGEIGERLQIRQPLVSKHLRVLKDAGLVDVEPRAQQRLYVLRGEPLREVHDWLEGYRQLWDERFRQMDDIFTELKRQQNTP